MLTLIRCPFHSCVTAVARKRFGHSANSAGGRLHLTMHTSLTQRSRSELNVLSRHSVGTHQGNELTRNTSGKTQAQSSQLVELLWTDPGLKSGICERELISTHTHTHTHTHKKNHDKTNHRRHGMNG